MAGGYVGILSFELFLPESRSLKDKRMVVRSVKAQLANRVGCSIAEVDHHEVWHAPVSHLPAWHGRPVRSSDSSTMPNVGSTGSRTSSSGRSGTWWASMSERMRRVNEAMRQVLSEAVPTLKDPRIGFVTVTGVETTTDLERATVWVSVLGSENDRRATLEALTERRESSRARRHPGAAPAPDPAAYVCLRSVGRAWRPDEQLIDEAGTEGR